MVKKREEEEGKGERELTADPAISLFSGFTEVLVSYFALRLKTTPKM